MCDFLINLTILLYLHTLFLPRDFFMLFWSPFFDCFQLRKNFLKSSIQICQIHRNFFLRPYFLQLFFASYIFLWTLFEFRLRFSQNFLFPLKISLPFLLRRKYFLFFAILTIKPSFLLKMFFHLYCATCRLLFFLIHQMLNTLHFPQKLINRFPFFSKIFTLRLCYDLLTNLLHAFQVLINRMR